MASKNLIIVESPTKAATIKKFLKDFDVIASMGHIRDLPRSAKDIPKEYKKFSWASLGIDVDNNFWPLYLVNDGKKEIIKIISQKAKEASQIFLATDEDREGESISWHIAQFLKTKHTPKRMVFHEITKTAILDSLKNTRDINMNLVKAQETRRILDRLVGYTVSPLLWKKIAPSLSAGRVQSVLVNLLVERELERVKFKVSEYYEVVASFEKDGKEFEARLYKIGTQNIAQGKDFNPANGLVHEGSNVKVLDKVSAEKIKNSLKKAEFEVVWGEKKKLHKNPPQAFITSTLQQEGIKKFKLSSKDVMRVAQSLYEKGFITYMRTDSTNLSDQAKKAAKNYIQEEFGKEYLAENVIKKGLSKSTRDAKKHAQEAHEAIRPSGEVLIDPNQTNLSGIEFKIYKLIWQRTIASQMAKAVIIQHRSDLKVDDMWFRFSGQEIEFKGFLSVYQTMQDENDLAKETILPKFVLNEKFAAQEIETTQHKTEPKSRYTESSLIKSMEKEGIGRPSTYAPILDVIFQRGYVKKRKEALYPTIIAFAVSSMLKANLPDLVDVKFTAKMENALDSIAKGEIDEVVYLNKFYTDKEGLRETVHKIEDKIGSKDFREIKLPHLELTVKLGRYGAFVQIEQNEKLISIKLPDDMPPADITNEYLLEQAKNKAPQSNTIGIEPQTGLPIFYMVGIYSPYLQLGETKDNREKPKRVSLPTGTKPDDISLDKAIKLTQLPIEIGIHPVTGGKIKIGIGRFGPYAMHSHSSKNEFCSVENIDRLLSLSLAEIVNLLNQPKKNSYQSKVLKEIGLSPVDNNPIAVLSGRFGNYIKWGKINATIPKDISYEDLTLEEALDLIQKKELSLADKMMTGLKSKGRKKRQPKKAKIAKK